MHPLAIASTENVDVLRARSQQPGDGRCAAARALMLDLLQRISRLSANDTVSRDAAMEDGFDLRHPARPRPLLVEVGT